MKHIINIFLAITFLVCNSNLFAQEYSKLVQPPYLQKGDTVMIIAPAGIMKDTAKVENGIILLQEWGLNVKLGKNLFEQNHHFAGSDKQRLEDFQYAIDDPTVKAIWCARGGYGSVRIIDDVDFTKFKLHPKWLIGFSDITVFHNEINNLGIETMHALMPITYKPDNKEQKKAQRSLKKALFGKKITYRVSDSDFNKEGEGTGQVVGGNLSILYSLLGTESTIKVDNKILFIEDIGEYLYHIDRMLISLRRNGYFDNCKGLIVGGISDVRENETPFGKTAEEVVLDAVKDFDFPVSFDFPSGHIRDNRTLILGRTIILNVKDNKTVIKFLYDGTAQRVR